MAIPWWIWMILAGLLGLAEMHVPGAYLMWIALGAALTGAVDAAFGVSLESQLAIFVVASALSCTAGYFVYRQAGRHRHGEAPLNDRMMGMLGERGTVCEAFVSGRGKVRLGDSVWLAAGADLDEGTPIIVSGVRGTRLVVEAVSRRPAADPPQAEPAP